jgi:hypothetical protein
MKLKNIHDYESKSKQLKVVICLLNDRDCIFFVKTKYEKSNYDSVLVVDIANEHDDFVNHVFEHSAKRSKKFHFENEFENQFMCF